MKQIIVLLDQAAEVLQPFTRSVQPGSLVYDGTRYVTATALQTPDPYALAWWATIQAVIGLLHDSKSLTATQLDYLRSSFCGGMGSFNDFSLDMSRWGSEAEAANARLSMIRSLFFHALEGITPSAA